MKQINKWVEELPDGRILTQEQHENGMHIAEIVDKHGCFECATICNTPAEIFKWIDEQKEYKEVKE